MSTENGHFPGRAPEPAQEGLQAKRHRVMVTLDREQMAAVEGWRLAHGIPDQADALGELVRIALLGEIAKVYRLVSASRPDAGGVRKGSNDA